MKVGSKKILRDGEPFVMGEIGVNHDGDIAKGRKLVEAAKSAGVDAVKFQLFRAEMLLAKEAGLVEYQKKAAGSAEELLSELELDVGAMKELIQMAQGMGMAGVVTPFSVELVEACVKMGVDAVKLASPDLVNRPLVEEVARTGLPVVLSTGAAELAEVERAVGWLLRFGAMERAVVLQCVSSYPTPMEHAALGGITALRGRFLEMPIGYSDHTVEVETGGLAVAAGACVLEKHLTLDRTAKGPDHAASLQPEQMAAYAKAARAAFLMRGPIEKKAQEIEKGVREQTRQSVVAKVGIKAGTMLTREMLTVKRPGTGIPAAEIERVIGRSLTKDVTENSIVHWEDVGGKG